MKNTSSRSRAGAGRTNLVRDSLAILHAIDCLEVGPIRLEKNGLIAPYAVGQGRTTDSIDLVYRFEEDVFEPDDPGLQNVADLIASQVALNYGLLAKRIIFNGTFDKYDRLFIAEMAAITAREIYVKKFLEPNPFLTGKAADLPITKRSNYLAAELIFDGKEISNSPASHWKTKTEKIAVLSSGGKDSLLSFGLLNELGYDVHPIYINESGRHWYTALNAYRYFKKKYPQTARVWTNADRVFNWMLRHLPYIRKDFASIRADEYPIRLWTVAVFLFGALPIIYKRGLGRLVIGDEYDTTRNMTYRGIPHYDGLFDQSRYFDNALSRYFGRKGWGIEQFSVLRPLAEMLIEKILVERYPHLQREQVSCHATHIEGNRVLPCGSCEKCRRIVGMLLALGADPRRCGYTGQQIKSILGELSRTRLRQDAASAEHLAYLLSRKGLILPEKGRSRIKAHSEILKIMVDKEKSPLEEIPADIRPGLLQIYLEHAQGTVEKRGNNWESRSARTLTARALSS